MKNLILLSICALIVWKTNGQGNGIWYMTSGGGYENAGTISGPNGRIDFFGVGYNSVWGLTKAPDGRMYGVASRGGTGSNGTLYSYDPSTRTVKKHYDFFFDGIGPVGKLALAPNGKLYGTTQTSGQGVGTLFEFDPASSELTTKIYFANTIGFNPGTLILAANGKLYGAMSSSSNGSSAIFEYDVSTSAITKKISFNAAGSVSELMQASNGKIYAVSAGGGTNNVGALFEYDLTTNNITKRHDFASATSGSYPSGKLLEVSGKLYGMCSYGGSHDGGTIYEFNPTTGVAIINYNFIDDLPVIAINPYGSLMKASDGKIYGTTSFAAAPPGYALTSAVFSFDIATSSITGSYFPGEDRTDPMGELIEDNGVLYGVTRGSNEVFEFDLTSSEISSTTSMKNGNLGSMPYGGLIKASNAKLYGMTRLGGTHGRGVLFEYDRGTNMLTPKVHFSGQENGAYPEGTLMQASNGKLYGMTSQGGENNKGVLFEYDLNGTLEVKVHFAGEDNGAVPYGDLIEVNSKLYGLTSQGGQDDKGTLFVYDPQSEEFTVLRIFSDASGTYPEGSLMLASDGMLYGVTSSGGNNNAGTLFQYDIDEDTFSKKKNFSTTTGAAPKGALLEVSPGVLFGTASANGASFRGTIFSYETASEQITVLKNFTVSDGGGPMGTLLLTPDGLLHGTTHTFGLEGSGSYFTYNPSNGNFNATSFTGTGPAFAKRTKLLYTKSYQGIPLQPSETKTVGDLPYFLEEKTSADFSVTYTSSNPQVASIENGNSVVIHKGGTVVITGMQEGDEEFDPAFASQTLTVNRKAQTISFSALDPVGFGNTITLHATASSELDVTYSSSDVSIATIDGNQITLLNVGSVVITASQPGNESWEPAVDVPQTLAISKGAQTITFTQSLGGIVATSPDFPLLGFTSSGQLPNYTSSDPTIASIVYSGGQPEVQIHKGGIVILTASHPGNHLYLPALNVQRELIILKLGNFFSRNNLPIASATDAPFDLNFVSEQNFPFLVTSSDPTVVSVSNNDLLTFHKTGSVVISYHIDGNDFYNEVNFSEDFTVNKALQTISFTSIGSKKASDASFELQATSSAGLPVTFVSETPSEVNISSGNVVRILRAGHAIIRAAAEGNDMYQNAQDVYQEFTIERVEQAVTFMPLSDKAYGDSDFELSASATSGLPITYVSSDAGVAEINGNVVSIKTPGTVTISAQQQGNFEYWGEAVSEQSFTIVKGSQSITFPAIPTFYVDDEITLEATTSSGYPVVFNVADESDLQVFYGYKEGSVTVIASHAGNFYYEPASEVMQTLTVSKHDETIFLSDVGEHTFGDKPFSLNATSGSGRFVFLNSSDRSVATIEDGIVTIVKTGTTVITASCPGNFKYKDATVTKTLVVKKATQSITFSVDDKTIGDAPFQLLASINTTLPIAYTSSSDKIAVAGNQVTLVKAGRTTITASQAGNDNYSSTSKEASFCIRPTKPAIAVAGLGSDAPVLTSNATSGNQWYRDGVLIPGATDATLTVTLAGSYKVQSTADDCVSEFSAEESLIITGTERESEQLINVYPNPATDRVVIALGNTLGLKSISIHSIDGREEAIRKTTDNQIAFNVSNFSPGIYLIYVETELGRKTHRFVKK